MTVLDEKRKMIIDLGFENESEKAVVGLKGKETKAAEKVLAAIDKAEYFEIYTTGDSFTIFSPNYKTQNQIKQFTRLLKKEYVYLPDLLDANDLLEEWEELEEGDEEDDE